MKERFKLVPFGSLILRKDNKVLLIRRYNTGFDDGLYAFAGGGVDGNETIRQAIVREAQEELGITVKPENLTVVHAVHRKADWGEYINFFIEATEWEGTPAIMEPNKCDDVRWFPITQLPENIMPSTKQVLELVSKNVFYSEFGWK